MAGTADSAFELYLARGADPVGTPDPNEINGAATIIGIQQVQLMIQAQRVR
jgi:hypothetical protein